MPLLDRFRSRPAWQSKDPEIRATAVRQLAPDQQELLVAIAREDADPHVRRLAVRKVSDPAALGAIAREDTDPGVRSEAVEGLEKMAMEGEEPLALAALEELGDARHLVSAARSARHAEVRRAAVARLSDPRSLSAVVRTAEDAAVRQAALDAIADPEVLADLALRCDHKDVAVRATERLSDPAPLEAVAARARHKAAARRARAMLDALAPAAVTAQPEPEETMVPEPPPPVDEPDEPLEPAAAAPAEELAAPAAAAGPEPPAEAIEETPAALPVAATEAPGERRAEQEELCRQADAAALNAEPFKARNEVKALRSRAQEMAPLTPGLAARFDAALGRAAMREEQARTARESELVQNLARVEALCEQLERLARAESLARRDAEQALRDSRAVLEQPPPLRGKDAKPALQRLKAGRASLFPRVQELREAEDWTRWANATQQEELCRRAEALAGVESLEEVARQLRELDAQWKQVRQAPRAQAEPLWRRFKAARDQAQVRCREYFAQQAQERADNLKRKQALCEQAEALAESTEWVKTAETLRHLQEEWKKSGPMPRRQGKVLWQRFRGACDRFFARRKEDLDRRKHEWAANQEKKEALCARAEELAVSTDWEAAASEIKRLQSEWKTVGPVRKSRSQPLWDRFHGACDRFFDRYKQRGSLERAARTAVFEGLCSELEGLADAPGEGLAQRVDEILVRWRQAAGAPEPALSQRRAQALARLVDAHPEAFRGTELDPTANIAKMEKLCARVEALLNRPEASGSLAERLREALAANTMGAKGQTEARWREATAELEAAQAAWKKLGPVPVAAAEPLRHRFRAACERFNELRPKAAFRAH